MKLHFQKIGNGQKILLAFHGIGQDFLCFKTFAETFADTYTTYCFDLPFHGKSQFPANEVTTKNAWKDFLSNFLEENQISNFSIIGFSMGGRFALATLEAFSTQIDKLILIAPDGISEHPLYQMATRFKLSRLIFKTLIFHHQYFLLVATLLAKLRLVPQKAIRFALKMLDSTEKQQQVYYSWLGFRELNFKMSYIAKLILQEKIEVFIFVGKYDAILPPKQILPLSKKLSDVRLVILETGHTKLVEKSISYLIQEI